MTNFRALIRRESETLRRLYDRVRSTLKFRARRPKPWSDACDAFRNYDSSLRFFYDQVNSQAVYTDRRLLEFVITFLEEDPYFFGSGYIKQSMLQRIKRSPLSDEQRRRLQAVVLDAIENRPYREYKHYCRLAVAIKDDELVRTIEQIAASATGARGSRARLMLLVTRDSGR